MGRPIHSDIIVKQQTKQDIILECAALFAHPFPQVCDKTITISLRPHNDTELKLNICASEMVKICQQTHSQEKPTMNQQSHNTMTSTDQQRMETLAQEKAAAEATTTRIQALAGVMAHQLIRPLAGISTLFCFIREKFPILLQNYRHAIKVGTIEANPSLQTLHNIEQALQTVSQRIHQAQYTIERQLLSLQKKSAHLVLNKTNIKRQTMIRMMEEIIEQYPFTPIEKSFIDWQQGEDFEIACDKHLITQVIHNLIDNALHSLHEAGKKRRKIVLWLKHRSIYIKDNGIGLDSNACKKLFDAFYSTRHNGTGLGLYFCQTVMAAHFGQISAKGRAGQSAHFRVYFPSPGEFEKLTKKRIATTGMD